MGDAEGYRGFNWLQQQNHKINHRRVAFCGVRDKEARDVSTGKGLRSPLDTLFTEMLRLEKCMYTRQTIRDLGVSKVWKRIIKQFRDSFPQEYLDEKDKQCQDGQKWVPPIMVLWDKKLTECHLRNAWRLPTRLPAPKSLCSGKPSNSTPTCGKVTVTNVSSGPSTSASSDRTTAVQDSQQTRTSTVWIVKHQPA